MRNYAIFLLLICSSTVSLARQVTYYHATDSANWASIIQNGLQTRYGGNHQNGASYGDEQSRLNCLGRIHLATSPEQALFYARLIVDNFLMTGLGQQTRRAVVFAVTIDSDHTAQDPDDGAAVTVSFDISPTQIQPAALVFKRGTGHTVVKF